MKCSKDFSDLEELSAFLQEELMLGTTIYDYYLETDDMYMSRREAQYIRRDIIEAVPGAYVYINESYDEYSIRIELED